MSEPVVLRKGDLYLDKRGYWLGLTVEDAMEFPDADTAMRYAVAAEHISVEYRAWAVAREDQEYALQLEDLRG